MKYASAAAFRMALEQRLLNLARETGLSLARLRKTVVFDRLLARLSASAPDRWVLGRTGPRFPLRIGGPRHQGHRPRP